MGNNEIPSPSCEDISRNQESPEIADTFNWSREEREKLNEDILVEQLRQKLIEKYPEQRCFFESAVIKVMQLGNDIERHNSMVERFKGNIFLLFGPDGELLSYLDQDGDTLFDISNFDFDNNFANLLNKRVGNSHIVKKEGKFVLFNPKDNTSLPEGNPKFNMYVYMYFIPKNHLK